MVSTVTFLTFSSNTSNGRKETRVTSSMKILQPVYQDHLLHHSRHLKGVFKVKLQPSCPWVFQDEAFYTSCQPFPPSFTSFHVFLFQTPTRTKHTPEFCSSLPLSSAFSPKTQKSLERRGQLLVCLIWLWCRGQSRSKPMDEIRLVLPCKSNVSRNYCRV